MASPIRPGKQTVKLVSDGVRVSRIRRDPPPPVKQVSTADIQERDAWTVVVGIVTFALALVIILIGFSNVAGWSPRQHTIHIKQGD